MLYVKLVSVVNRLVLNWVEQKELRGLASDDRLYGEIADNFKCRMGGEDLSHVQFNSMLWNLQPIVKGPGRKRTHT